MFDRTQSRHRWEAPRPGAINMQRLIVQTYPPLSVVRYSFIQLSEMKLRRMNELPKGSTQQHRIWTRVLLLEPPNRLPLRHCATAPLRHCATAPLRHCATAPLRHCATAPLRHCTTAPLRHYATAPLLCLHPTQIPGTRCSLASPFPSPMI